MRHERRYATHDSNSELHKIQYNDNSAMFDFSVGARYFFAPALGVYLNLGSGVKHIDMGLTLRF
jgi:hypothetical protein